MPRPTNLGTQVYLNNNNNNNNNNNIIVNCNCDDDDDDDSTNNNKNNNNKNMHDPSLLGSSNNTRPKTQELWVRQVCQAQQTWELLLLLLFK